MDKDSLWSAINKLPGTSHPRGSSYVYKHALSQYNEFLKTAKALYPERPDIQSLQEYALTSSVQVEEYEDAVRRLQTAGENVSSGFDGNLFFQAKLPSAESIKLETTFASYSVQGVAGEGGAGRVYRATDEAGRVFAVKLLDPNKATRDKRKRFKNELLFGQKNHHQNIISVTDHGIHHLGKVSVPFYVMPYYETSLRKLLVQGFPREKALMYFAQLLDGVEAAHLLGIVHRDIKPENILLDASNDLLLLADFGIAHFEEEALFTAVETGDRDRLANFQYAAPEQRTRGGAVGRPADIYALGLILNEMFTGQVPLGTDYVTISDVVPEYEYLDSIIRAMLRQTPENRPQSIELLKEQLIGKQTEFVTRQRLSELKQTVVPVTDLDDPLVIDPPRLIGADYRNKQLFLRLSRAVNIRWIYQLQNLRTQHTYLNSAPPQAFEIRENIARIDAAEDEVQVIVDRFKEWLPLVNQQYQQVVSGENVAAERKRRMEIQSATDEAETRLRVLRDLKI